jgi:hypothetical protein
MERRFWSRTRRGSAGSCLAARRCATVHARAHRRQLRLWPSLSGHLAELAAALVYQLGQALCLQVPVAEHRFLGGLCADPATRDDTLDLAAALLHRCLIRTANSISSFAGIQWDHDLALRILPGRAAATNNRPGRSSYGELPRQVALAVAKCSQWTGPSAVLRASDEATECSGFTTRRPVSVPDVWFEVRRVPVLSSSALQRPFEVALLKSSVTPSVPRDSA